MPEIETQCHFRLEEMTKKILEYYKSNHHFSRSEAINRALVIAFEIDNPKEFNLLRYSLKFKAMTEASDALNAERKLLMEKGIKDFDKFEDDHIKPMLKNGVTI